MQLWKDEADDLKKAPICCLGSSSNDATVHERQMCWIDSPYEAAALGNKTCLTGT